MTRSWNREALLCGLLSLQLGAVSGCETTYEDDRDDAVAEPESEAETGAGDPEPPADAAAGHDEDDAADDAWSDAGAEDASAAPAAEGDTYALTSQGRLLAFARATGGLGRVVTVTGVPDGEALVGADIRPSNGKLYALSDGKKLYTIDLTSGVASLTATLAADASDSSDPFGALSGSKFGVDFNPVPDRLRVSSDLGQNLRINVDSGAVITDGSLNPSTPGISAAAYTNSFASACRTRLFVIDRDSGTLLLQDPPNDGKLSAIGKLGIDVSDLTSFEIVTPEAAAERALVALSGAWGSTILDLDLATGAATHPRPLALKHGETVLSIAAPPPMRAPTQPVGELLGLNETGNLISFNRAAPGKLCSSVALSQLEAGEVALGMDVRPADGAVYVLGSKSKIYTIDVASGAATLKSVLSADPADTSEPFSGLPADEFGVGFNPVPDRLRVVTRAGVNLRINVDTGATTTDAALSTPGLSAVAYTNSFAGARSTTLYALDTHTDSLVRIGGNPASGGACPADTGNPNCGVVTSIGALGLSGDVSAWDGFDIDPKAGSALSALHLTGAATSTLYAIDLATGSASLPPGVANGTIAGGARLRGLAFSANPQLTAFGVSADNQLVAFKVTKPGNFTAQLAITGLSHTEVVVGIDVRPLDGKLYALSSESRLYAIDPQSGVATLVSELRAAAGDDEPFCPLDPRDFGVDFNPVVDLLRVVTSGADNLRVVPSARNTLSAGDVFTDAALNPTPAGVSAAAYTQSFAGTSTTTLYVIDSAADTLSVQGGLAGTPSPNTGTLSKVGQLGVDASGDVGFDISGAHNGLALAALRTSGSSSALFVINLATGAATPFNAADNEVGGAGAAPLRGLALELK